MIYVIATIEVAEGKRDEFVGHFKDNLPHVLAEDGCLDYGPAVDLETGISVQIPMRDNVVTVVEKWESMAHLEAHLGAPHMATYREKVKDIVGGVTLQILEPA